MKYRSSSAAHFKNCHSVRQLHILVHKGIELFRELSLVAVIIFLCFLVKFDLTETEQAYVYKILNRQCRRYHGKDCAALLAESEKELMDTA